MPEPAKAAPEQTRGNGAAPLFIEDKRRAVRHVARTGLTEEFSDRAHRSGASSGAQWAQYRRSERPKSNPMRHLQGEGFFKAQAAERHQESHVDPAQH